MLSPSAMRRLDQGVGVPLCWLMTWFRRLARLFAPDRPGTTPPANVLVIELAEMGSAVLAVPALLELQARVPGVRIHFLLFKHIADSARILGLIPDDQILTIDATSLTSLTRDTLRVLRECRRRRIDTSINLEAFARFSALLGDLCGARRRIGFHRFTQEGLYTGDLLTDPVPYNPHMHTAETFMTLVSVLWTPGGVPRGKAPVAPLRPLPRITPDAAARERVRSLLRDAAGGAEVPDRIVLVNPNASKLVPLRRWPIDAYTDLVGRLVRTADVGVALIGVASERPDAQYIIERVKHPNVFDMTGRTSLVELIHLCAMADALVTNDSGPAHFAALTDVPIFVFFGPETPKLYAPLSPHVHVLYSNYACSPCVSAFNQRVSPCDDNQCLKTISVDVVEARVRQVL